MLKIALCHFYTKLCHFLKVGVENEKKDWGLPSEQPPIFYLISIPPSFDIYQARARRARRACELRALGLLLADGTPTVGGGKTF